MVETLANFVKRKVPLRWALVPNVDSEVAQQQARVVYHLLETYGLAALMEYLEGVSNNLETMSTLADGSNSLSRLRLPLHHTKARSRQSPRDVRLEGSVVSCR